MMKLKKVRKMAKLCPKGKAAAKRKFKFTHPRTQTCTRQEFALVK